MALAIFDTFIIPINGKKISKSTESILFAKQVLPITRHFNVLLEGYGNLRDEPSSNNDRLSTSSEELSNVLFDTMIANEIKPDAYTITSLLGAQRSPESITKVWMRATSQLGSTAPSQPCFHAAITAYGRVGDPSSACYLFHCMMQGKQLSANSWNVLLSALSKAAKRNPCDIIRCYESNAYTNDDRNVDAISQENSTFAPALDYEKSISDSIDGKNPVDAAFEMLVLMKRKMYIPNAESYCSVASALSQSAKSRGGTAIELYKDAKIHNVPADGRFVNAILRCFDDDIDGALLAWKKMFRKDVLNFENMRRPNFQQMRGKNLIAAYHGLIHVAGKAQRPDIALRLAYAMQKEDLEPTESTLNSYRTGTIKSKIENTIRWSNQFENLLTIECSKYDKRDKRRLNERRVRIIV